MQRISNYQLFSLMMLFQIGTTIIFGFGSGAGRDAWISVLLSAAVGMLITSVYAILLILHPGLTLVEWFPKQFGKWPGTFLGWLYPLLFIYNAGRVLADMQFLIPDTLLPHTPPLFTVVLFVLLLIYGLYKGVEVLGRLGGILLPFILFLFLLEIVFLLMSGTINLKQLLPIAGKGWAPILETVWPTGITQSFGEMSAMTMLWPLVKRRKGAIQTALLSTLGTGLFIAALDILALTVIGEPIFKRAYYPMYILLRQIEGGELLDNLDVLAVLYFVITAFFKTVLYLFAAIRSIQLLASLPSARPLVLPVSVVALFMGMTMTDNLMEHIMGVHMTILSPYFWIPLQYVLPMMLLLTAIVRKFIFKKQW